MKPIADSLPDHRWWIPSTTMLLAAAMGLTFLLRMNFWSQPFEMDEGLHAYMGWGMLQGLVPFKDMYNTKPPGIYVLHSLLFLFAEPTALNIKVFASIYTLITAMAVFFVARKIAGDTAGLAAALFFGIFSSGPNIQGGGVNSEVFMILPYTLAAHSLITALQTERSRSYLLAGIWTGVASTMKQVAVVNLFWVAGYLLVRLWLEKDKPKRARVLANGIWVFLGSVLPWLPFLVYFYYHAALGHFYFWMVNANFKYIGDNYRELPNFAIFLSRMKKVLSENGLLWILALFGVAWGWQKLRLNIGLEIKNESKVEERWIWILMATWPLFSFLGVILGGRFFAHYYIQLIPALSVPGGVGLVSLIDRIRARGMGFFRRAGGLIATLAIASTFVLFVKTDLPYYVRYDGLQISLHQYGNTLFSVTWFIGNYLRGQTESEDFIYVWAVDPEINFYALRKSPSPFLIQTDFDHIPWNPYDEVMQSLQEKPPKYIVAMQDMSLFPGLKDYVRNNFREETSDELNKLKVLVPFEIYRRKGI